MFDKRAEVKDIMTRNVICVSENTSMDEVKRLFQENDLHHLPVVSETKVVGIISTTDLNKVMHHFTLFKVKNTEAVNDSVLRSLLAKEVMSHPVATIQMNANLMTVASVFRENLFHALPVVDGNGDLVGMVTPFDLMNYAYGPDELALANH